MHRVITAMYLAFLTALTVVVTTVACQSPSTKPTEAETKLSPAEQKLFDDYKAEIEIGRSMAGRLMSFYGTYGDKKMIGYVNQVGNYVAGYGDYPERRYMFAILNSDAVNAFACPGGYILVTLGTLRRAKNEAELGAILGHEVTHVGKQHMLNTLKDMNDDQLQKTAAEGDKSKDLPESIRIRQRPKPEQSSANAALTKFLKSTSGAGLGVLQAAKAGMSLIMEKGLSPKLEYEADQEGVKYAIRAGYDPRGLHAFLDRLEKEKKAKHELGKSVLEKTHPSLEDRKTKIASLLKEMNANEIVGALGKKRFEEYQATLPKKE